MRVDAGWKGIMLLELGTQSVQLAIDGVNLHQGSSIAQTALCCEGAAYPPGKQRHSDHILPLADQQLLCRLNSKHLERIILACQPASTCIR